MRFLGTLALTCALTFGLAVGASAQAECDWEALVDEVLSPNGEAPWIRDDFGTTTVNDALDNIEILVLPEGGSITWTVTFEDLVHVVGADCTLLLDNDDNPWWIIAWDMFDGVTWTYPDDVASADGEGMQDLIGDTGRGNSLGDNGPYGLFIAVGPDGALNFHAFIGASGPNLSLVVEGATFSEEGGDITLSANGTMSAPFQWQKDGSNIGGETGATYAIVGSVVADSGDYSLIFDDGAKAPLSSNVVSIAIFPAGSLPVAGLIGLGLLAAMSALAGGTALVRMKK